MKTPSRQRSFTPWFVRAALVTACSLYGAAVLAQEVQPAAAEPAASSASGLAEFTVPPRDSSGTSSVVRCANVKPPKRPSHNGALDARIDVEVSVLGGKVIAMESLVRRAPSDRQLTRSLVAAIHQAIVAYDCSPFSGRFIQSFEFR